MIDFAHPLDLVAKAENESASSTNRERVHRASAFDRNGNTSTAILGKWTIAVAPSSVS
jgi:hypothetical protein